MSMIPSDKRGESGKDYRSKLMIGINLYGMHYPAHAKRDSIRGSEVLEILEKPNIRATCEWDEVTKEHVITWTSTSSRKEKNYIYFPTPLVCCLLQARCSSYR
jgi:hypothetical protein